MNDTLEESLDTDNTDSLRAGTWALLGQLLAAAPAPEALQRLGSLDIADDEPGPLADGWRQLAQAAARSQGDAVQEEYQNVFIGVGGGEVTPYASWYLTGTLMDRPLVQLRSDLEALGIERISDCSEPEDHAAAVCEIMSLIIQDQEVDADWQRELFERHAAGWMTRFFEDLGKAPSADFYRAVAAVGHAFVAIERRFYEMPV